jgi:hypothetical protein
MSNHLDQRWEGPIAGLRLPIAIWYSLQGEGITTINQLQAVADRLEELIGIGPKFARLIREELARAAASKE